MMQDRPTNPYRLYLTILLYYMPFAICRTATRMDHANKQRTLCFEGLYIDQYITDL